MGYASTIGSIEFAQLHTGLLVDMTYAHVSGTTYTQVWSKTVDLSRFDTVNYGMEIGTTSGGPPYDNTYVQLKMDTTEIFAVHQNAAQSDFVFADAVSIPAAAKKKGTLTVNMKSSSVGAFSGWTKWLKVSVST